MSEHKTHTQAPHAHAAHSTMPYAITLAVLLVLTVITVVAAGFNFGSGNVVIALGIATIKASLVALVFMHLRHDKPINAVIAVSGFLFLGLFLIFCLTDIDNRDNLLPGTLKVAPSQAAPAVAPTPAAGEAAKVPEAPKAEHH
jgi:cytochrome c oxidase subunit IV